MGADQLRGAARLYANPYLLLALASLCWSGNHIIGRAIAGYVPPVAVATLRWLLAAAVLWPFVQEQVRREWPRIREKPWAILFLAAVGGSVFGTLQFVGLQFTTALNVSVLNSMAPIFIVAASAILFRDRLTVRQGAGIAISLLGVLVIISRLDPGILAALSFNRGDIIILLNQAIWGVYSACLRLRPAVSAISFMFIFSLTSGLLLLPALAWEIGTGYVLQPTLATLGAVIFITLISTIGGFALWTRGVELIGPNRAGVFLHLIPIYSAMLAGLLLGEPLMGYHVIGFVLILLGVWCTARS